MSGILAGIVFPNLTSGRATLTSGTPVTVADVLAATSIFWTPANGKVDTVYDANGNPTNLTFAELTLVVPSTTSTMYDVFEYNNAGVLALEALAWTNDTTRATALVTNVATGVRTKSGDATRKYIFSCRTTTVSGQTEDSATKRYISNCYNRAPRSLQRIETASWAYTTATPRQANASASNQVAAVIGVAEILVRLTVSTNVYGSGTAAAAQIGIGLNVTNAFSSGNVGGTAESAVGGSTSVFPLTAFYNASPAAGLNTFAWVEWATSSGGTNTWNSLTVGSNVQGGINGWTEG